MATITVLDNMEYGSDALARSTYGSYDPSTWLSGWLYRKSITLSRSSGAVTNYQMMLLVGESSGATGESVDCNGHCLSSFNDLRFTKSDGTTLLDYWIESISGTTPNQLATVWIEFDSIGTTDTSFFMYYGNSGASDASNGENTFPFFDDFNDASIDTNKWYRWLNSGSYSESGGEFAITGNPSYEYWGSKTKFGVNFAYRGRVKVNVDGTGSDVMIFGIDERSANGSKASTWPDLAQFCIVDGNKKMFHSVSGTVDHGTYINRTDIFTSYTLVEIRRNSTTNLQFVINDSVSSTVTNYFPLGNCGIAKWSNNSSNTVTWDWALVRQYLSTEPSWGTWGSEIAYGTPVVYSEPSTLIEGSYSLKGIAAQTTSLNKTLTRAISSPINLTGHAYIIGKIRASRTGSNIKIGFHDSGGTTTEVTPNITAADTWQNIQLDISGVSDANKDAIDQIIITVVNADYDTTFYLDILWAISGISEPLFNDAIPQRVFIPFRGTSRFLNYTI